MKNIVIYPYSEISDEDYSVDVLINVSAISFVSSAFRDGQSTFSFNKCRFRNVIVENNEEIQFNNIYIDFVGCYIEHIEIRNILSTNISVGFFSTILSGRITSPNLFSVTVRNSIVKNGLFLVNQNKVYVVYNENSVFPKLWRKLLMDQNIEYSELIKAKQFFYIEATREIVFESSEVNVKKRGLRKDSHVSDEDYKINYLFTDKEKASFNIHLTIQYSSEIKGNETKILASYLNSLTIYGRMNGSLSIENTKINNWYISEFVPKGDVVFYNINPYSIMLTDKSKISIHKCNLDEVWFDNVDFDKYKTISLYRSRLAKTNFTSCNFPKDYATFEKFMPIENVHYPERKSQNHHKDQYEIFLQLKKSLESSGNYFEAQNLQAIAHDALKKIKSIPWHDSLILEVGSFSNNHGQSISKPFKYFIIFSLVFYIGYLCSLDRIFNTNEIDWTLVGYYFSFIDLTHRADFLVEKKEFNFFSLAIDYLNKIVCGFFIYQFIAAFRKFGKK